MACSQLAHVPPPLCNHQGETSFTHLHTGLLAATLCALHRITGLAAAVIAICIGLAAVEVCEGLVLIAPAAQLDGHSRWSIDHLRVNCAYLLPHVCVQRKYAHYDWTCYTDLDLWADCYAYGSWTVQYIHRVFP